MPRQLSPTQIKLMEMFEDGRPHDKDEIRKVIDDCVLIQDGQEKIDTDNLLRVHISLLRQKVRPSGMDVLCISRGRNQSQYRLVRLLGSEDE